MLKATIEMQREENTRKNLDLCHIAAIPNQDVKYYDDVTSMFKARLPGFVGTKRKVFDLKDDHAAAVMCSVFRQKQKIEFGVEADG